MKVQPGKVTSAHRFSFNLNSDPLNESVLAQKSGPAKWFSKVDSTKYYLPAASNHRAFESMCVAESNDKQTQVLCLFQSKINGDLKKAIEGLNTAVIDLSKIWTGHVLFVIFALESPANADLSGSNHPTLLVCNDNLEDYFTATLAPAAKLCFQQHQCQHRAAK